MGRFTSVLWDNDGTLLDFLYSQHYAITKCFESIGRQITEEMIQRYSAINDGYWKRFELGEVTKDELLSGRFLSLFEEYGITGVDVLAFRGEYQEHLGSAYQYIDDSLHICKALAGKVKQYVITNGVVAAQEKKLRSAGFYDVMDGVFISEQIGTPKPQKGFFDHCMKVIGEKEGKVDKQKFLIVGDSLTSDIKGGILYGIPTCWYRPKDIFEKDAAARELYEQYKPDYEISDLHEIFDVLGIERD